jgi:putative oxidoreductase
MKYLPTIAGALLGLLFVTFSLIYFFKLIPMPPPPEGSPVALFMGAMAPTGYMNFVKACELIGGILVAIPLLRNLGLLILGPIIVNILAFHIFLTQGAGLLDPPLVLICILAAYLVWAERKAFAGLIPASTPRQS